MARSAVDSVTAAPHRTDRVAAGAAAQVVGSASAADELVAERVAAPADGWLREAKEIADYIGAKPSRVYPLATCTPSRILVYRDGKNLVAKQRADIGRHESRGEGTKFLLWRINTNRAITGRHGQRRR